MFLNCCFCYGGTLFDASEHFRQIKRRHHAINDREDTNCNCSSELLGTCSLSDLCLVL